MRRIRAALTAFVDSGVTSNTTATDARYVRFVNATLLLIGLAELPILPLLLVLELKPQFLTNLIALGLCALGFVLNRHGHHLQAKLLLITVLTANTSYFAVVMGSVAPTHLILERADRVASTC